jgi:hypothetical protein
MLLLGLALERLMLAYGQAPYFLAISSTSGGACSGLNLYAGPYIHTFKLIQGILIVTSTLQPSTGTSSSSTLAASLDQDSVDDYPEIRGSTCENSVEEGRLIIMVASAGGPSYNSSSRYPIIGRLETSNDRTPNDGMI